MKHYELIAVLCGWLNISIGVIEIALRTVDGVLVSISLTSVLLMIVAFTKHNDFSQEVRTPCEQ